MTTFTPPVVAWRGEENGTGLLVVLLHGRGSDETDIIAATPGSPIAASAAR